MLVDLLLDGQSLVYDIIPQHQGLIDILEAALLESQKSLIEDKKSGRDMRIGEQGFCPRTLVESPEGKRKFSATPTFMPKTGTDYEVRVTAYDDGPRSFFVQFTSQDESFQKFQCDLQSYKGNLSRKKNESKCIAIIDGQLRRATILRDNSSMSAVEVTVRLMETGAKALVAASNIFAIPLPVADVQPFAMRFRLAGLEEIDEGCITESELHYIFHRLTNNKVLILRLVESELSFFL